MQAQLSKKFKVSGIPTLLFLDATDAKLITGDGRSVVMDDTEGSNFPWKPLPFSQMIEGKLVDNKGNESSWSDLKDKVIGLYFSAHWVSPGSGPYPHHHTSPHPTHLDLHHIPEAFQLYPPLPPPLRRVHLAIFVTTMLHLWSTTLLLH